MTGRVFEAEGGRICICDGWRTTDGVDRGAAWAPAEIGEAMKELLKAAKKFDEATGQPDCEMKEKVDLLRKIAKMVGVDFEEVLKK